jgi:type II secretory pathway pseudopilin PulG
MANSRGFSFLEAVICVAIILVLTTTIMPILVTRKATEDRIAFISQLNRLPVEARESAINENAVYHLMLDGQQLVLKKEDSSGNTGDAVVTVDIPADYTVTDSEAGGQDVGGTSWDVKFYPDGTCDQAGISFKLGPNADAQTLALNVDPQGHVNVSDTMTSSTAFTWPAGTFDQKTTTTP